MRSNGLFVAVAAFVILLTGATLSSLGAAGLSSCDGGCAGRIAELALGVVLVIAGLALLVSVIARVSRADQADHERRE